MRALMRALMSPHAHSCMHIRHVRGGEGGKRNRKGRVEGGKGEKGGGLEKEVEGGRGGDHVKGG